MKGNTLNTVKIIQLAKSFDAKQKYICCRATPPTTESIIKIERHFGFKLPNSMIEFSKHSKHYGNWLASLGEDFNSYTHIIKINDEWRNKTDKSQRLPENFLIINVGYDEDFDCIDLETYDDSKDEYFITYWYPGIELRESSLHDSFYSLIKSHIRIW